MSASNHSITKLEVRMHFARAMWHTHDSQLNWWMTLLGKMFSSNWPKQQINSTFRIKPDFRFKQISPSPPKPSDTKEEYQWNLLWLVINLYMQTVGGFVFLKALKESPTKSSQGKWTPVPRKSARCVTSAVVTSWVSKKKKCINFSWHVMEPHSLSANIQVGNTKPTDLS